MPNQRHPWWFFPNLWSIDAPLVAVTWMYMLGRAWRQDHLQWHTFFVLGAVVWTVYVADRMVDSWMARKNADISLKPRHLYHRQHKYLFGLLLVGVLSAIAYVVTMLMPRDILILGIPAFLVSLLYFSRTYRRKSDSNQAAKNCLAGLGFAFGVAAATAVYLPFSTPSIFYTILGVLEVLRSPEVLFFAVLCIVNINAIDVWEKDARVADGEQKFHAELSLSLPLTLLAGAGILMTIWTNQYTKPYYFGIVFASIGLYMLNRHRHRFSLDALRVLADLAMIAPVLVFFVF